MNRVYAAVIRRHLQTYNQMTFIVGPRQVGKTTLAKDIMSSFDHSIYLNWDITTDRLKILSGQNFVEDIYPLNTFREEKPLIVFDEIHKYKHWKNYIKGFFDSYKDHFHIIVTGSARLDLYQSSGDSLMGRYFQYRVHPLSVGEIMEREVSNNLIGEPQEISKDHYATLCKFGGFPEPFCHREESFYSLWQKTRGKQLIYEDIQSIEKINDISLLEAMSVILREQVGQLLNRTSIGKKIGVSTQTVSRWLSALEKFYYCYLIKPWSKNVTRSLIKEPKVYLWDWSVVKEEGARFENFVASHLLKFIHYWNDLGKADLGIYYLRDIDKREADFLITRDSKPWFIIEAKSSPSKAMKTIEHFQKQLQTDYNFEMVNNMGFIDKNCFQQKGTWRVPAKTFLSQLI